MDFKHTSIKQSALGWVKKSIDDNLAAISSELNIYIEEKDASLLTSVQAKLSDLQGVLTMIEQFGAAMLTEEMQSLCAFISDNQEDNEQALEVLLRAVLQLPDYLEHLQAGHKDIPFAILPILNDIRAVKNEDLFSEKLLFLPDLSMHMDDSEADAIDDAVNQQTRQLAKKVRPTYQISLLGLIKDKDVDANLARLEKISEIMEEHSNSEQVARLWWIIGALVESMRRDNLPLGVSTKMLLGKVDSVLRNMVLKGEKHLISQQPIELIKNLLFYIAQPECDGPKSQAIKTAYRLEQFLPSADSQDAAESISGPNQELLKTVSDAVKADLEQVKSTLEVYVNGDMSNTDQLKDIPQELHVISDTLAMIGLGQQRQMIESQINSIGEIVAGKAQPEQEKLLAMAAELLQVDHALELMQKGQYSALDADGETGQQVSSDFEMDNMLSAVVTAALDDIQKIKDAILDFIKDSTKEENIRFCENLLQETRGALKLLNEERAVHLADGLIHYLKEQDIVEFMDTNRLDQLSQVVVSIEYYLEAVGEQRADADSILDYADSQLVLLLEGKVHGAGAAEGELIEQDLLIADDDEEVQEVDEAALADVDLDNMEADLGDEPEPVVEASADAIEMTELMDIDEAVADSAEIVDDISTGLEQIQETLAPAEADVDETVTLASAEETVTLASAEAQQAAAEAQRASEATELMEQIPQPATAAEQVEPSVEPEPEPEVLPEFQVKEVMMRTTEVPPEQSVEIPIAVDQVAASATEQPAAAEIQPVEDDQPVLKGEADEEILEIYLEEAEEETENIIQLQHDWKQHPNDENALKNIRRAFHTIKGSGRLVGAMKIGEFAWDFENLLNRVIDKTVPPNDQVIDAIGQAGKALEQLVKELKGEAAATEEVPHLRGLAQYLAEFKPEQAMEVRQAAAPAPTEQPEPAATPAPAEQPPEQAAAPAPAVEPEPEPPATPVAPEPVTAPPAAEQPPEPEPQAAPAQTAETQQEETPPDPFVSSAMASVPGGEVEPPVPASQSQGSVPNLEQASGLALDPELLVIYQQEVEAHLNTVNTVLDQGAREAGGLVPTEELYRALHTIHGASRTANISSIGELAGLLEKPLKTILEQGSSLDAEVLDLYRQGHDSIREMAAKLVDNKEVPPIPHLLKQDLQSLNADLGSHTVDIPVSEAASPSDKFLDTLTMMNEAVEPEYDDELVEIFIEEATDLLEMSDHTLQSWNEQEPGDPASEALVMELQRYLHTLKGGAKMAEFLNISDLSHELESLFIAVIDGRVDKSDELVAVLHESFDLLQKQVEQAQNRQPMESSQEQIRAIRQLREGAAAPTAAEPEPTPAPAAEAAEEEDDDDRRHHRQDRRKTERPGGDRRGQDHDIVKVRSDLLDNLVNSAGEVSIYRARMEQQVSSFGSHLGELGQTIARLKNQLRALEAETDAQILFSHKDEEAGQNFDPLEMDRYSQIQQLSKALSESVEDLSSLQNILGEQVKDSETLLLQQSRINTDLQDGLIRSRMVRFAGLSSRLRRLVRQTSSELAKKAELVMSGEQNEVDIKVLDRMVAPLEHIIRNAIAHGVESPMERLKKGKAETGKISIDVARDGSDIVLRISDDGGGINVDKVRRRAYQLGLLAEDEQMEDSDLVQFILEPGFSTADQLSQISGRGVGMDVVDSSIKQLGGSLQISTSPEGTQFLARLPFTLSINQAILVRAGEESYALPLINIEGITRIESDQIASFYQEEKPALDYAGQHYGLHYLSTMLDTGRGFYVTDPNSKQPVILLRSGDLRIALHIDEIIGNREIVVKPLGKLLSPVKGISGGSILADGKVVLILDINGLVRHGVHTQVITETQIIEEAAQAPGQKVVMVVDDSITMRRVATKLLTRNNYEVITAKDGVDALAQLEDSQPDVMLLDIEMPRMDGFELATHMRNEARYRNIPIIMITSRTGSKHREHAMGIGINKYMGKPYQEEELIENISELVG